MRVSDQEIDVLAPSIIAVLVSLVYITTSLARRDHGGARLWALAFLFVLGGAVVTAVQGALALDAWTLVWAAALGNAFVVGAGGCFLLGALAYRRRPTAGPSYVIGALTALAGGVTLWTQQSAQQWPGTLWTLVATAAVASVVCVQWMRRDAPGGVMRAVHATGFGIGAVASILVAVTLVPGVEFRSLNAFTAYTTPWLAALAGTLIVVSTFALRESADPGRSTAAEYGAPMSQADFTRLLRDALRRASPRLDAIAVIGVWVEDIGGVRRSFGADAADRVGTVVRSAVRSFSSPLSLVGSADAPGLLFVATTSTTPADARRQAGLIYRGVVSRLVSDSDLIVPEVGVGVALTSMLGYSAESLMDAAARAAETARASDESSVVVAVLPAADT